MRIQSIYVANFLGLASADLKLHAPVQLFAGRNGAGKSSLRDAVALALTADLGRVSLKKEAGQLVHAGTDASCCEVTNADGDTYSVTITAAGKIADSQKGREPDSALSYVLDAQRFARLESTERRAFLFGLMGVKMDQGAIAVRLEKRGCMIDKIHRVLPLLRTGFDAASKEAKSKATEAKGAWRALTGETYGAVKAEGWKAPAPEHDAAASKKLATELQHCDHALEQWQQSVGKLQGEQGRRAQQQARLPALNEQAALIDRTQNRLTADESGLAEWEQRLQATMAEAGQGQRKGLVHDLAKGLAWCLSFENPAAQKEPEEVEAIAAVEAYEREHGKIGAAGNPEAQAKLPEVRRSRDLMASAVTNGRRDLEAIKRAQAEIETIKAELDEAFDVDALNESKQHVDVLKTQHAELVKKLDVIKGQKAAADAAEKKTTDAAAHHADVTAWDAIGDALSPDGIPAEILAEALGPMNERLAQSAADATWPAVVIAADMAITAGDREYRLLSESEKWRADAMLAEAVANLSNTRLLVLDRFDVLDLAGRGQLLGWLDVLADNEEIDTALVFGTLKALPAELPGTIQAHWIENGVIAQLQEAA